MTLCAVLLLPQARATTVDGLKALEVTNEIADEAVSVTDKLDRTKIKPLDDFEGDKAKYAFGLKDTLKKMTLHVASGSIVQLALGLALLLASFGPSETEKIREDIRNLDKKLDIIDEKVNSLNSAAVAATMADLDRIVGHVSLLESLRESALDKISEDAQYLNLTTSGISPNLSEEGERFQELAKHQLLDGDLRSLSSFQCIFNQAASTAFRLSSKTWITTFCKRKLSWPELQVSLSVSDRLLVSVRTMSLCP